MTQSAMDETVRRMLSLPPVLMISIGMQGDTEQSWAELGWNGLAMNLDQCTYVTESKTEETALSEFEDRQRKKSFSAVLITTADLSAPQHLALHEKVVDYVRGGGTAIYSGLFCYMMAGRNNPSKDHFAKV
jgi:hypothetical protein